MGFLDTIAARLGYGPLTQHVALDYVSPWAPTGTLSEVDLALLYSLADQYLDATRAGALTVGTVNAGRQTIVGIGSRLPLYTERAGVRDAQLPLPGTKCH